jgi:L-iditol 2-dehydrogenase
MGTMNAAILHGPRKFVLEQMPVPEPADDELLVHTTMCGICTSEVDIWEGRAPGLTYPRFIGHEPAGVVARVGKQAKGFAVGDHVSVWSEGKAYAEYFTTPAAYAVRLRADVPLEHALGEPIACATNGALAAQPQLNESVCLVGTGFMGLIMLQVFRATGVGSIIAVDPRESSLTLAQQLGATHTLNPRTVNVVEEVRRLTGGQGVDIGVELAGRQETLDLVGNVVRMEGTLEVFGFHQGAPRAVPWGFWNWMAFRIVNGHVRSASRYVQGLKTGIGLLEAGRLNMAPMVTHRFPLDRINDGFAVASEKPEGYVKAVVVF